MKNINLSTMQNPKSIQSEAYRTLRTNLQFASAGGELKTIVVTSSAPGEGKSTTATNLAVTLANSDNNVLLMDCDLRKPSLNRYILLSSREGLTNVLAGMTTLDNIIQDTEIPRLQAITSGPIPPNPAELLNSQKMKDLIGELEGMYDYIIIDSPPTVPVTDSTILSTMVDGVILVISSGETPIDIAQKAKENLEKVNAKILGVVINKIKIKGEHYHYYNYDMETKRNNLKKKRRRR
jgi:capsular exopolysaccharide synthesis family protein